MQVIKQQEVSTTKQIPKKPFIDSNTIHSFYKINPRQLQSSFNKLRSQILQKFDEFKTNLLSVIKNINYLRYIKMNPHDDIKFIFKQKMQISSLTQIGIQQKQSILNKMSRFQILRDSCCSITQNCIWEIQKYINDGKNPFNFQEICPSGVTFLNANYQTIQEFMPYWKNNDDKQSDLTAIFKQASKKFPEEDIKKLGRIFSQANKSIVSARLIFRASEHNFQSNMFKQICNGRSPTLLIAKSDKDLVFGGYTPCKWLKTKEKQYVADPQGQSFLFSLTHDLIFPIKRNQLDYAISAYGGWGPIFGSPYGPDLSISDKCHQNDHSCSSLGSHYQIPTAIKQYSNEAFSLLAGAKKFKVVEYQVYEIYLAE